MCICVFIKYMEKSIQNKIKLNKLSVNIYELLKYIGIDNSLQLDDKFYSIKWYDNGQRQIKIKKLKSTSFVTGWHRSGIVYVIYNTNNCLVHGIHFQFYENGNIQCLSNYINGQKNGLFTSWYANGDIHRMVNYKHGKMDGLYRSWYPNGQLRLQTVYKDGLHHYDQNTGKFSYLKWHPNGQLHTGANYEYGEMYGLYKQWDENGKLLVTLNSDYEQNDKRCCIL